MVRDERRSTEQDVEVGIEAFAAQAEAFTSVLPDDCSPEAILEVARSLGRLRAAE